MRIHDFDVVVLGAGPAGEAFAGHAADAGLTMDQLRHAVAPFPSRSEIRLRLNESREAGQRAR